MAYADYEYSNESGLPVFFVEFMIGNRFWYYTNADRDMTVGASSYTRTNLSITDLKQSAEPTSDGIDITLPTTTDFGALFKNSIPASANVWVRVRAMHYADGGTVVLFKGAMSDLNCPQDKTITLSFLPVTSSAQREGLRLTYGRNCPHFLYDISCKVDKGKFRYWAEITSISATGTIICTPDSALPDYSFKGGFIEYGNDQEMYQARDIDTIDTSSATNVVITVAGDITDLTVGSDILIYAGCDRTPETCADQFDNLLNFGGFKDMPGESPFDGSFSF